MAERTRELTGLEKASVLVMCLQPEQAARVMEQLTPEEQDLIGAQVLRTPRVDARARGAVLDEVNRRLARPRSAGIAAPPVLPGGVGALTAHSAFSWLEATPAKNVAEVLASEKPGYAAIVLKGMSPRGAEAVLSCMPASIQESIVERMAHPGAVSGEALEAIEKSIRLRLSRMKSAGALSIAPGAADDGPVGGKRKVKASPLKLLSSLRRREPPVVSVESPEEVVALPDRQARAVLQAIRVEDIGMLMRVATDQTRAAILRNLPAESAQKVREMMQSGTRARVSEIEAARQRFAAAARAVGLASES